MRLESHRKIPDDASLRAAWNSLCAQMDRPEVFYTWEWAKAMECAYSGVLPPLLVLGYEADALVGVASLYLDADGRVGFLAGTTADYCDFVARREVEEAFVEAVVVELRSADCREAGFANLPKDSRTPRLIKRSAARHGYTSFVRDAYECAQVALGEGDEREQLRRSFSKKKWFRRNMASLGRDGAVTLRHLTTWAEAEPAIPGFARSHVARFLSTRRISNLARADRRVFLSELAKRLCETKNFCLSRLTAGDRPIAWNYGFRFRSTWFWYQPTFVTDLEEFSPGRTLLTNILLEACADPQFQTLDMGLGAEGYKERFANAQRTTEFILLSRSRARVLRESIRYRAAEGIKRSPALESAVRKKVAQISAMREQSRGRSGGLVQSAGQSIQRSLFGSEVVHFYQWKRGLAPKDLFEVRVELQPINYLNLADAVMMNEGDREMEEFALRSAERLQTGKTEGLALLNDSKRALHFCWVQGVDEFRMPRWSKGLNEVGPGAVMLFDEFTPAALRGEGWRSCALALLAERLERAGKQVWVIGKDDDPVSLEDVKRAGFERGYSMISKKMLGLTSYTQSPARSKEEGVSR